MSQIVFLIEMKGYEEGKNLVAAPYKIKRDCHVTSRKMG